MHLIDSHCHLHFFENEKQDYVINEAYNNGIKNMLNVCTKLDEIDKMIEISNKYEFIYNSIGIHPCNVKNINIERLQEEILKCIVPNSKIIAIGETGLDLYKSNVDYKIQEECFIAHIEISRKTKLPMIIHSRNCDDQMISMLQKEQKKGFFNAILHSFASTKELCITAISLGLYISFSGIVTFKNAQSLVEIAKNLVPLDKILIETDSPYLAPTPKRGKQNKPFYLHHTADFLNSILNINNIQDITYNNFKRLFF